MTKMKPIRLPEMLPPKTRPMKTTSNGMTWNPRQKTTKSENVAIKHAKDYNRVTSHVSILNTGDYDG